eukprot:gene28376-35221_t
MLLWDDVKSADRIVTWEGCHKQANAIVSSLPESIGRSPIMNHAVIRMLSRFDEPQALFAAISLLQDRDSQTVSAGILPESLVEITKSAFRTLCDEDLTRVLGEIEFMLSSPSTDLKHLTEPHAYNMIMKTRICAACRLGNGYEALKLLRQYKTLGGVPTQSTYHFLISALFTSKASNEEEASLAMEPNGIVEWLLREMNRDGINVDGDVLAKVASLYTRAIQKHMNFNPDVGIPDVFHQAELCIRNCLKGEGVTQKRIEMTEHLMFRMCKNYCAVNLPDRAFDLLSDAAEKYPDVVVNGTTYLPLLHHYALAEDSLTNASDVKFLMEKRGVALTTAGANVFVLNYIEKNQLAEALQMVEALYDEDGVTCNTRCMQRLLDKALENGDRELANQVVETIRRLFSNQQRVKSEQQRTQNFLGGDGENEDGSDRDSSAHDELEAKRVQNLDNDANYTHVTYTRRNLVSDEEKDQYNEPRYSGREGDIGEVEEEDFEAPQKLCVSRYMGRVPMPREKGSLTDKKLKERFNFHGLSFD